MQASVPHANLGTCVLRSGRYEERDTDLKKASGKPGNNGGKHNLAVMQEVEELYDADRSPECQRKVPRQVGAIDTGIVVKLDTLDKEHHLS